jgi:hypothetical protein
VYGVSNIYGVRMILLKWAGTILCLIGITLTSFNIYPANVVFGLVGSLLWTLAGFLQRDVPLFLVEAVAVVIYFIGMVTWLIN